jgi:DNA-binding NarL/FixJ family response regulator
VGDAVTDYILQSPRAAELSGAARPKILIVERYLMIAESLAYSLDIEGFQVKISVPTTKLDLEEVLASKWHVVLLSIDLETRDDVSRFLPLLSDVGPVVVLTAGTDRLAQAWCIEAGAVALADKERPFGNLLEIVRRVIGGETLIGPSEKERLLELSRLHASEVHRRRAPFLALTAREQGVLSHLLEGQSVRTIARVSSVSESTVRSQIRSIFQKLGVNSQLRAVSLARQVGWTADLHQ